MSPQDLPSGYEGLRVGFTAAVSHELRTPLARLLSLLDTAKLPGVDVQELIEEACAEVVEMTQLVDDILFLSELEQGREVVALGFTEVAPYVDGAVLRVARARAACRARARERRAARPGGADAAAHAARGARQPARQLTALCRSRRHLPHHGPREGDNVVLEVSDDGAGVDPDDVPRLFERFFRSDRSRTTRGTGLGLAIVKHIVGAAEGTAEVEGSLGEGTRFRFTLPAPRDERIL